MSKALQGIMMVLLSVGAGWFGGNYLLSVKAAEEHPPKPTCFDPLRGGALVWP
ncbi:MAG: hypothetical protein ACI8QC_002016 [Planctomycetota bacterium]|jgi:hypothetical protein